MGGGVFMQRLRYFVRTRFRRPLRPSSSPQQRSRRIVLALLLGALMVLVFMLWTESKIRPVVQQMANTRVHYLASAAINGAMSDVLSRDNIAYDDLVVLEKNDSGAITAIKTNMIAVNRLKTDVCAEVLNQIHGIASSDLSIPLGSVINNDLLTGRGPKLSVRLVPLGTADATFQNVFSAAGINQTRHQITMNISVEMSVLTMGSSIDVTVESQMVIAETIIVGSVPNTYADLEQGSIWDSPGTR